MGLLDYIYGSWKDNISSDKRWYLQSLLGDRTKPLTEKDLTESELSNLKSLIKEQGVNTSKSSGYVGDKYYEDSLLDDNFLTLQSDPLQNTLGRFTYKYNPDNTITVIDNYDFSNEYLDDLVKMYGNMSTSEKVLELSKRAPAKIINQGLSSGLTDVATEVGTAFIGNNGRPIKINIK